MRGIFLGKILQWWIQAVRWVRTTPPPPRASHHYKTANQWSVDKYCCFLPDCIVVVPVFVEYHQLLGHLFTAYRGFAHEPNVAPSSPDFLTTPPS